MQIAFILASSFFLLDCSWLRLDQKLDPGKVIASPSIEQPEGGGHATKDVFTVVAPLSHNAPSNAPFVT